MSNGESGEVLERWIDSPECSPRVHGHTPNKSGSQWRVTPRGGTNVRDGVTGQGSHHPPLQPNGSS